MSKSIYKETQRYRRWEIIGLLGFLLAGTTFHFWELYLSGGYKEGVLLLQYSLIALILTGILLYLWSIRLVLKVDEEGVRYQFYPLHYRKQKIYWDDILEWEVIDTPVSAELSGWAIRLGTWERMFSVSGRTGLWLRLKDGRQLFIGSKQPGELERALKALKH